jgi:hypothetical protein
MYVAPHTRVPLHAAYVIQYRTAAQAHASPLCSAATKVAVLAVVLMGADADVASRIRTAGIGQVTLRDIKEASERGARLKLVCSAEAAPAALPAPAAEQDQGQGQGEEEAAVAGARAADGETQCVATPPRLN